MLHTLQTCSCFTSCSSTERKSTDRLSRERTASKPSLNRRTRGHTPAADPRRVDAGEVKEGRPIHQRDPLFAELFKNADRIEARHELTTGGVRVIETSKDAYVVKLLQAHAEVVSAFLAHGMSEMMKNHPVPPR